MRALSCYTYRHKAAAFFFGKEGHPDRRPPPGSRACPRHMRFRSFRLRDFLYHLIPALVYPVYALVSSGRKLVKFIDALTIVGFILLVLGVVLSLIRHGDYDISEFVIRRSVNKGDYKPFRAFKDDKREKRKDSMNYPLFIGILFLAAAALITIFVY